MGTMLKLPWKRNFETTRKHTRHVTPTDSDGGAGWQAGERAGEHRTPERHIPRNYSQGAKTSEALY